MTQHLCAQHEHTSCDYARADTKTHTVPVKDRQDDRSDNRQRRAGAVDGSRAKIAERERKRDGATESHLYVAMATSRGVCVCTCVRVWLSWKRAATHLEVSVHNIMLVDMIDTLQDLTNAVTTEREEGTEGESETCQSPPFIGKRKKNTTHLPHMTRLPGRKKKKKGCMVLPSLEKKKKKKRTRPQQRDIVLDHCDNWQHETGAVAQMDYIFSRDRQKK